MKRDKNPVNRPTVTDGHIWPSGIGTWRLSLRLADLQFRHHQGRFSAVPAIRQADTLIDLAPQWPGATSCLTQRAPCGIGRISGVMMNSWCTLPTMTRATGTGSLSIPTAM